MGVLLLSAEGSKLIVDRNDEQRPHCLRGRGAAGKIIINNNENLLGTHLATKFNRHCTIHYSDQKKRSLHPRLPSTSSNQSFHQTYLRDLHTHDLSVSIIMIILHTTHRRKQQEPCGLLKAKQNFILALTRA